MGVVLPGWADEILDLIGVSWPNVDEDDYRGMADAMREFADDIDGGANEAHTAIQGLVGSAGGSVAVEALNAHWTKINGTHLKNLGECGRLAATALDGVAVLIEGAKIGAIVQLGILAAEVIAAQAAAPFTFGLSELGALAGTQATRLAVRRIFKEVCQQVAEQVISIALTPVEEALGAMVGDLVVQLGANALGVQDGVDLGHAAQAGKDGFKQGVQGAKDSAKSAGGNPMQLLSAGGGGAGGGGGGRGGGGASGGFSFDPDEHDRVVTGLQSAGGTFRNKAGGKIGRARSHHGRTRGKDAIADAANAMLDKVIDGIEDGVKKTAKHLDDNMTRGIKQMAKNHHDNDRSLSDHFKSLGKDGKGDPKGPNSGSGTSSNSGGGRGSGGRSKGGGRGRKQVENPREAGRPQDSVCQGGEPVDMATGRMFIDQMDVSLPGSLPMLFRRSFESGYQAGRWMGPRWVCTFDERLEIDDDGVVYLSADRTTQAYPHPVPGEPTQASAGARLDLDIDEPTGDYTLTDVGSGLVREFTRRPDGETALLTGVRDRAGHRVDFAYDAHGTPLSMTHSGGYRLLVTTEAGRITALHLAAAGENGDDVLLTRYGYTDGHLTEVYNTSGRPLLFANDAQGRILSWTDRNGTRYLYTYDALDRVVEEGGADGSLRFRFEYGDPDPVTGLRTHCETNVLGHTTRYQINEHAQVVAETDPLGNTTLFERDEYDCLLSQTDPLGRTTRFTYDDTGGLVAVTRPDGERSTAAYFGDSSLPTLITRPGGLTWRQTFDEAGRRTSVTDPTGATTRYGYDESGHLAAVTDALGNSTRIRCDPAGLPLEVTDRAGATSHYERDAFGRVTTITDQLGGVTRLTWSAEGRLTSYTAPDGSTETWAYDDEGNLLAHTDRLGQVTTFAYTPFETLAARTNPDGTRLTFTYDADMQLVGVTNSLGQTWEYVYDAAGRLISETDFHGRTVAYRLDATGQVVSRTNPLGQRIEYTYDVLGQLVAKDADGAVTSYAYDLAGHLVQATSPDVDLLRTVDALGNLVTETTNGRTLTHTHDILGRRTRRTTPGGHTSTWTYDQADRRTSLTTDAGRLDFAYDAAGHETERTLGDRLTLANAWDTEHRLTGQILRSGQSVLQRRDYTYRADGILTGIDDQLNGPRTFDVDTAGRVTAIHAATWTENYAYDPAGNLTEAHWPADGAAKAAVGTRTYDGTQLTTAGRVRYEYDAAGRTVLRQVTRLSKKPASWHYTWDAEDRLTHVTTPDGTRWRYVYDPFGRRTSKERLAADGITVEERTDFTWDGATLAEQTTYAPSLPGPYTMSWDHRGLHPLAQTETITRTATADAPQDEIDSRFFAIVTDLVGTPTELVDTATDTIAWRAVPTLWGNTTWATGNTTYTPLRFPGQYFDPETGLHYNLNRYYDPRTARYTTPDPLGLSPAPNPDAYVHNPHTWCDPLGLMPDDSPDLKKELMGLGKKRIQHVADGLGEDDWVPKAYSVGRDRTTGKVYYGESGPETGHDKAVTDAMPKESQRTDGRPPGVCGEPRMFTNAIKDGADPKNIDLVTVNDRGKKFKMCENCSTWVPGFGGEVLTG
ncbi:RHS repeat-associated core domain-containing protein [Streptomyces sp. NPDC001339]|uniref:RHS repeat-associated core domain-containing protein n=1 Tax=Streptomyces sp. NPDC001339 TaxID=3364563 RepID=UPI0036B8805D